MKPIQRRIAKVSLLFISLAISLVLCEGLATVVAWWKYGTVDIRELIARETSNAYGLQNDVPYFPIYKIRYPHPYLGWVFNKNAEGDPDHPFLRLNNIGLIGRDMPFERDPKKFTILLTGASVADAFCQAGEGDRNYLEEILNRDYAFGREVVVVSGACGAWRQPNQTIMLAMYGDAVDAVVNLDGVNESKRVFGPKHRLEIPGMDNFLYLNPIATPNGAERLVAVTQTSALKDFSISHPYRTVYFATCWMRQRIEANHAVDSTEKPLLAQYFLLPENWSKEHKGNFNLSQYKKYVRLMSAMSQQLNLKQAYFIQPCAAVGKELTAKEKAAAGDLKDGPEYRKMADEMMKLKDEGIPVVNLLDVFADVKETVYHDSVHCVTGKTFRVKEGINHIQSDGYRIMAEAMAEQLASLWGIARAPKP